MLTSKANATWSGDIKTGQGVMKPAHGPEASFSLKTRVGETQGTNPEEMIGAALAGCFSMALSLGLGQAGATNAQIKTDALVHLDTGGGGFTIKKIELTTVVQASGIDAAKFAALAAETKKGCPVSKALAGTEITLDAKLA